MFERYQEANQEFLENLFSLEFPNDSLLMYPVYSYFGSSLAIGLFLAIVFYFWYKKSKLDTYPALKGALLVVISLVFFISFVCYKYAFSENNNLIVGSGVVKVGRYDDLHILNRNDVNLINLEKDGFGNCQITLYTYKNRHFIKIPMERTNVIRARDCNVFSRMSPNEFISVEPVVNVTSVDIIQDPAPSIEVIEESDLNMPDSSNIQDVEPGNVNDVEQKQELELMGPPIELMNQPGNDVESEVNLEITSVDTVQLEEVDEVEEELVVDFMHGVLIFDDELDELEHAEDTETNNSQSPVNSTENIQKNQIEADNNIVKNEVVNQDDLDRKLLEIIEKENNKIEVVGENQKSETLEIPPRFEGRAKLKVGSDELIQSIINSK